MFEFSLEIVFIVSELGKCLRVILLCVYVSVCVCEGNS